MTMAKLYANPSGKFSVGCVDVMTISSAEDEGVFFRLFYPIEKPDVIKDIKSLRKSMADDDYEKYINGFVSNMTQYRFVQWCLSGLHSNDFLVPVQWNKPVLSGQSTFPLILLAPGYMTNRCVYEVLCSELASRGFIVASVEFRDGAVGWSYKVKRSETGEFVKEDISASSTAVPMNPGAFGNMKETDKLFIDFNKMVRKHVSECEAVVKFLEDINGEGTKFLQEKLVPDESCDLNQFKNRIDLTDITLVGFSLGGSTAVTAMGVSKKFTNFVSLDGTMLLVEASAFDKIYPNKNCLFIFADVQFDGKEENFNRSVRLIEKNETKSKVSMNTALCLNKAIHMSFCDMGFSNTWLLSLLSWGKISPKLSHQIVADLIVSFLASVNEKVKSEKSFQEIYNENKVHLNILKSDVLKDD